ncbi:MAG: hypothetical protein U0354_20750 [Candidatus Sericytochromatia bacterium]
MKRCLLLVLLINTSCSNPNLNIIQEKEYTLPNTIDSNTKLSLGTFKTFDAKDNDKKNQNDIKTWFNYKLEKDNNIVIDKVVLSDNNKRIDDLGDTELIPDYSGSKTNISIKGKFNSEIVQAQHIIFKNEDNLLQLSYVGEEKPKTKILIDDSILLEVISANKDEIKCIFSSQAVPDYYLKGLHKLSIISEENKRTDTLIKIGEPIRPNTSLSPSISEIKIIKKKDIKGGVFQVLSYKDDEHDHDDKDFNSYKPDTPINIKIKGKNFPMFYKFSYSTIDSQFGFGHSTAISKDTEGNIVWESIIHIPNPKEFEKKTSHFLTYSTPFGTVIKRF